MTDANQTDDQPQKGGESTVTVIVALAMNALIAVAKTVAALLTGSASMVAEAAHSWADTGNEIFLVRADRRSRKPADAEHPLGYGRETYVWSLFAAFGLFTVGAVVSIWHGISSLTQPGEHENYLINYVVLALAFVLEGVSFLQASRQAHGAARKWGLHPAAYIARTSDPTVRAVFLEDAAALVGVLLAGAGVGLHQLTGSAVYDAVGSIAVGLLLGAVAVFLIDRNRRYLIGEQLSGDFMADILREILDHPDIDRVTYFHVEFVGPSKVFIVAAVDLTGDDREAHLAVRLRDLEHEIERSERVQDCVLTLSAPSEESVTPETYSGTDRARRTAGVLER